MERFTGLGILLALALGLAGCATGDPRLQGTWRSNKVPMPVEMVKVTKMETVKVRKGSKRTKQVAKTVTVAQSKSAPAYIPLIVTYEGASLTITLPPENGKPSVRRKIPYKVAAADDNSVAIDLHEPATGTDERIHIVFESPNRYTVSPAGGEGWKEYYDRIDRN